jgi:hypothetical protein
MEKMQLDLREVYSLLSFDFFSKSGFQYKVGVLCFFLITHLNHVDNRLRENSGESYGDMIIQSKGVG